MSPQAIFLIFLYILKVVHSQTISNRIVGGQMCKIKDYPYQVSIYDVPEGSDKAQVCSGVLLTYQWVLTAAHCFNPSDIKKKKRTVYVIAGSSHYILDKEKAIKAKTGLRHTLYKEFKHDIGLLELEQKINQTSSTVPAQLAKLPPKLGWGDNCKSASISGWGEEKMPGVRRRKRSLQLKCAQIEIVGKKDCILTGYSKSTQSKMDRTFYYGLVPENGTDACVGDSGGPLVCQEVVIGIISSGQGCGNPGTCSLYAKVEAYSHWIRKYSGISWAVDAKPGDKIFENAKKDRTKETSSGLGDRKQEQKWAVVFLVGCLAIFFGY